MILKYFISIKSSDNSVRRVPSIRFHTIQKSSQDGDLLSRVSIKTESSYCCSVIKAKCFWKAFPGRAEMLFLLRAEFPK